MALRLRRTHKGDEWLQEAMRAHYSTPGGFVGRSVCFTVCHGLTVYGHIVAGSATRFLPGRSAFLSERVGALPLGNIVNNIFFHLEKQNGRYPARNFASLVIREFRAATRLAWREDYGDEVIAFETLVELPRIGDCYIRDGWKEVGVTKGQTCRRVAGQGSDSWSGRRVWDTVNLRPKRVFLRMAEEDINRAARRLRGATGRALAALEGTS